MGDDRNDDGAHGRASVVLVAHGKMVPIGPAHAPWGDLALVDDLLRLQLAAQRLGWSVRLVDVCSELRELVVLVGVQELLVSEDDEL